MVAFPYLYFFLLFGFCIGFRPTNGGRLIRLLRRGMCTGQTLFPLEIKPDIPQIRPWKELFATRAQATWLSLFYFRYTKQALYVMNDRFHYN